MEKKTNNQVKSDSDASCGEQADKNKPQQWEKPVLEDVSGKIMAQPYIRFT